MPRLHFALVVLLLGSIPRMAVAGLPRNVTFELGGAYERIAIEGPVHVGGGGFVGARVPLRPWISLGGEVGVGAYAVEPTGMSIGQSLIEGHGPLLVTAMSTAHFTVPVRTGMAPFAVSQTGVALLRRGERREYHVWYPGVTVYPATSYYVFCSALGFGLRGTWPRPAPGFEVSVRLMMLAGERPTTVFAPRLSLTY